ncbi:RnfABCDGE type electron transport complex subunit B [Chlamydiota bacterium]
MILLHSILLLGTLGLLFGSGLAYASKKFSVIEDDRIEKLTSILPGANCGVCGFPGCRSLAKSIVSHTSTVNACIPGGSETAEQIAQIMGVETQKMIPQIAIIHCQGGKKEAKTCFLYQGIADCIAANNFFGGNKTCTYGCLGFGNCYKVCPFHAIVMTNNRLPVIDPKKCTGCGKCVEVCPKNIISLLPRTEHIYLACSSKDKGKIVKEYCLSGCFGCTLCANPKVTPSLGVIIKENLPKLDYTKEHDFSGALEKCPTKCFVKIEKAP